MKHIGIYDLIADLSGLNGSTNWMMFLLVGIPVTVSCVTLLTDRIEKASWVVTYGSRFHTWHVLVLSAILFSFIFTCFILAISFFMGSLLVGTENTWLEQEGTVSKWLRNPERFQSVGPHLATYKIVVTLFVTKFLGIQMIAFCTLFFKQFIKSGAVILIICIALLGIDYLGIFPFPIFVHAASLSLVNWVNPMITVYRCFYLLVISFLLYGITGFLYDRKDFLS